MKHPPERPLVIVREWRPAFGGALEVSSDGLVRKTVARWPSMQGRPLAQRTKNGYRLVSTLIGGVPRTHLVHRLVAEAFVGPCPSGHDVNHIDADKSNNVAENLEYVTRTGNMRHAAARGLLPSKLTIEDAERIRERAASGEAHPSIAAAFGVAKGTVWKIVRGWAWLHAGGPVVAHRGRPSLARRP
jgi:hypothetical protein